MTYQTEKYCRTLSDHFDNLYSEVESLEQHLILTNNTIGLHIC
mgnify:CR=1|jgi:hypothetical protein